MSSIFSRRTISHWCTYLVLILVNISYCPGIILTTNYKIIMAIIMTAITVSLLINIKDDIIFAASLYLYYGVYALLLCSIVFLFSNVFLFTATINIYLAITCFLFGYCNNDYNEDFIIKCMKIYILSALFLGLYSVYTNLGGFVITEQYAFKVKNSSGVLLGTAIILTIFVLFSAKNKALYIIWASVALLLSACLLTFRCRTSIIAVCIAFLIVLYKKNMLKGLLQRPLVFISFVVIAICLYVSDAIPIDYINDALFKNTDTSDLNSVTSGRIDIYKRALSVFYNDPLLGNSSQNINLYSIDNYIINVLGSYGIIGALLMFPPYILTFIICAYGILYKSTNGLYSYFCLLIILLTSFTEGPYPFGPGTPVICAWFLLGWTYKASQLEIQNSDS